MEYPEALMMPNPRALPRGWRNTAGSITWSIATDRIPIRWKRISPT